MIKRFLITGLISIVVFSGFCLGSLKNASMVMPMAKAQAVSIDSQGGCEGQKSIGTQMNCCISHPTRDTESTQIAQSEQGYKKVFLVVHSIFKSFNATAAREIPVFEKCDNRSYQPPPSLTGIVVKKE